jgi:hypothetical protein
VKLTKRDIFFFLERLSEQTKSFVKYQYKKQFAIFRNFRIKGGNVKLTSYILQQIKRPSEIERIVEIYNILNTPFCSYTIGPLPCLFIAFNVKKLNTYSKNLESTIGQELERSVNVLNLYFKQLENSVNQELQKSQVVLNTMKKETEERMSCLVNYTINSQ